jgi:hypothetical protein
MMHPRPAQPAAARPAPAPTPRVIYGQTFTGDPDREALEIVGEPLLQIRNCRFVGGSTCLRLNGCGTVEISGCTFAGMTGPADPDGQCIQLINPRGPHTIDRCVLTASPQAEDLINVFCDAPATGSVLITGCSWIGRGASDSSTSLCMDGPFCVPVSVRGGRMQGARCGITVAGLGGTVPHSIEGVRFVGCQTRIYVYAGYDGRAPKVSLSGYVAADVLIGEGMPAGAVTLVTG